MKLFHSLLIYTFATLTYHLSCCKGRKEAEHAGDARKIRLRITNKPYWGQNKKNLKFDQGEKLEVEHHFIFKVQDFTANQIVMVIVASP